ncbi:hypothetical protein C8R45DRAFT_938028 [Mycena sanguinolenta]|nr:hypothetical protein C8R45DRAFT_938028 [Mycena sanguinolenta]
MHVRAPCPARRQAPYRVFDPALPSLLCAPPLHARRHPTNKPYRQRHHRRVYAPSHHSRSPHQPHPSVRLHYQDLLQHPLFVRREGSARFGVHSEELRWTMRRAEGGAERGAVLLLLPRPTRGSRRRGQAVRSVDELDGVQDIHLAQPRHRFDPNYDGFFSDYTASGIQLSSDRVSVFILIQLSRCRVCEISRRQVGEVLRKTARSMEESARSTRKQVKRGTTHRHLWLQPRCAGSSDASHVVQRPNSPTRMRKLGTGIGICLQISSLNYGSVVADLEVRGEGSTPSRPMGQEGSSFLCSVELHFLFHSFILLVTGGLSHSRYNKVPEQSVGQTSVPEIQVVHEKYCTLKAALELEMPWRC